MQAFCQGDKTGGQIHDEGMGDDPQGVPLFRIGKRDGLFGKKNWF